MARDGGFPIPAFLHDLFNKIAEKKDSLFVREEEPRNVKYTYKEFTYRGVPINLLDTVTLEYVSHMHTEVFKGHYDESGNLLRVERTVFTNKSAQALV